MVVGQRCCGGSRLTDFGEQFLEPRLGDVERLAALDAGKFDGAEAVFLVLVVADHAAFAALGAFHRVVNAALDEGKVGDVGRGAAGEVAAFLHEGFFSTEHFGKLLAEPFAGIDGVELDVAEGVARDGFPLRFHFFDDIGDARSLADEDVHAVVFVHHAVQAGGLGLDVDDHFRNVDAVDVKVFLW